MTCNRFIAAVCLLVLGLSPTVSAHNGALAIAAPVGRITVYGDFLKSTYMVLPVNDSVTEC